MLSNFGLIYSFGYVIIILIMAKNNNRYKNQKKYSQRRDNLVGVKRQPLPRNKRERQIQQLSLEMEHFNKVKKQVAYKVRQKLGYDFNSEYTTNPDQKLEDIVIRNEKHPQRFSIPMDPQIVEKFIAAPKYIIKSVDSLIKGENHLHEKTQHICMAVLDEGPMLFEFYNHLKYPYGAYSEENFNIGFFALLQGADYFHINRYDSLSLQGHTKVFDDDGNVVMKYISREASKNKPHSHPYDIRYAVLFTGKDSVGHDDRRTEQKYSNYETAVRAWMKKLNVISLNKTFSDDLTIGEIYEELKRFEAKKSKQFAKKQYGGEKWNSKNFQSNSKTQSQQKE